jgi:hypothetical protein
MLLRKATPFRRPRSSSFLEGGKGEVPRVLVSFALARAVQRQHIGAEQHADTDVAKPLDAFGQRGMLGLGGIQVGKHHHWQAPPGRLTQQPKREGVGDPRRPLVDGVEGRRGHYDGVRLGQHVGLAGQLVVVANCVAGALGEARHVEPLKGPRRGDQADVPAVLLRQVDEDMDVHGGRCGTGDDVEHLVI